ncbi:peptidase [candidate division WWE3 bacterium RIFCSPHIGHO2_12_FULL_38_15]|uniref:Peptidase n=1 Tax=candidate division WWE3 bacterium RIFCSPHIGHO2_02_FULL_38_14 TaxID=1802620 RepID=A0A1F4V8W5_UNCKA|nr:MAG: peptidase [candidate division WWE3 bacterium RIFCSPHIGHO2_01_FULL_38_45]OGC49559.1 MAG: peptidase [candidate division WWE3 bacterium RIFCSPHIGHO2_12_FULL_38_15]OGC53370.1 MAG: peptidase [candidate division WWE3 bacterium RIFCSPHIGHO2_02_FULL_38_14]
MSIQYLRNAETPGSDLIIEQTLTPGSNYQRYIASYKAEGLKIYALLTIPNGTKPKSGWPVVIFNHGYIPPTQYKTTERYIAYTDAFSRNGYILLRSDYRGHGNSEGTARGGYGSPNYTIDILNAVESIKKHPDADPNRIGMWGHSMGGYITLRSMVSRNDIKAGVIWAGVVVSYEDLLYNWRRNTASAAGQQNTNPETILSPTPTPFSSRGRSWRAELIQNYGPPEENPEFWNSISATGYLNEISGPLQLHHGTSDTSVPLRFSEKLEQLMKDEGKSVELFTYAGNDHNISASFNTAIKRSVDFFDKYVKSSTTSSESNET